MTQEETEKRIKELEVQTSNLGCMIALVLLFLGALLVWSGDIEAKIVRLLTNQTPVEFQRTHSR